MLTLLISLYSNIAEGSAIIAQDTTSSNIEKLPVVSIDVPSVEQSYLNLLKLNPDDPVALNNIGMFYLQVGNLEQAKKYLSKAVDLYPDDYITHYNLGTFYGYLDDIQNTIKQLNKAIELNPKSNEAFSALGTFYFRENKLEKAENSFSTALNINPKNSNALFGLMSVYQNENLIDSALETGKKLLTVDNKYQQLHLVLSNLYFLKNDYGNALTNAKEEQLLYPDEPESYYMPVLIYDKTGNDKNYLEAANKLKEVIKMNNASKQSIKKYVNRLPLN
jgi:tetratricopeptide (TPR) repeat protein